MNENLDRLTVSVAMKLNIGNYESLQISAGFTTDRASSESIDEAYTRAWEVIETQLEQKVQQTREELEAH